MSENTFYVKEQAINKEATIIANPILRGLYNNLSDEAKKLFIAMCLANYIIEKEYYITLVRFNSDIYKAIPFQLIKDELKGFMSVDLNHEEYQNLLAESIFIQDSIKLDIIFSTYASLNRVVQDGTQIDDKLVNKYFINVLYAFIVDNPEPIESLDDFIILVDTTSK